MFKGCYLERALRSFESRTKSKTRKKGSFIRKKAICKELTSKFVEMSEDQR
jgi:hypothetical protein